MKCLFVLVLLLCISVASAIKCYQCTSTTDMADCAGKEKEQDCGGSFDRCLKYSLAFKVASFETKAYAKSCSTKAICDGGNAAFKNCKDASDATCQWDCCDGDLCNGGTTQVISVFLMVACALMALFR